MAYGYLLKTLIVKYYYKVQMHNYYLCQFYNVFHAADYTYFDATAATSAAPLPDPSSDSMSVMSPCGRSSLRVSSM